MFKFGRRDGYRLEVFRGIFRPKREDVPPAGGGDRKFIINILHQTLKSNPLLIEVNFAVVRYIGNRKFWVG